MAVSTARPGAAQQAPQRTPFRYGTRQRFAPIPINTGAAWASTGRFSADLPRVGFLAAIMLRLTGTFNLGAAGTLTTRGPWDLIREIVCRVNIGAATIYRTTGFGNYIVQRLLTRGFDPAGAIAAADGDVYGAGVAMGNNTWTLEYWLPICENYGRQSTLGLINLQAPEVQVTLEGQYGANLDVVAALGGGTGFSGNLDAGYLFYEVPDPKRVAWPPLLFHRIIESRQVITAIGDQTFLAPREGIIHRLTHIVQQNDARTAINRMTLRFNRTDEVYRLENWEARWLQGYHYGAPLPVGVYPWEFWAAEGYPGEGDNRDMISSEALSTLESIVNTGGAVGGTLNALDTVREFVQIVAL